MKKFRRIIVRSSSRGISCRRGLTKFNTIISNSHTRKRLQVLEDLVASTDTCRPLRTNLFTEYWRFSLKRSNDTIDIQAIVTLFFLVNSVNPVNLVNLVKSVNFDNPINLVNLPIAIGINSAAEPPGDPTISTASLALPIPASPII